MHPEVVRALRWWRAVAPDCEGLAFPFAGRYERLRMGFKRDDAGLPQLIAATGCHRPKKVWHSLRHTFAASCVMAGVPLYTLQRLMGHATAEQTMVYAHLSPDHLASEVARLSFAPPTVAGVSDLAEERRKKAVEGE